MPVSKKRKRAGKVVKRQSVLTTPDPSKSWNLKIKPSQMHYLKSDPDFASFAGGSRCIVLLYDRAAIL